MFASLVPFRRCALRFAVLAPLALAAALLGAAVGSGAFAQEGARAPVLTVTGAVASPNRPPFDAFRDAFFAIRDEHFDKARAFDRAALAALPQVTVKVHIEGWPQALTLTGPSLASVLADAGVGEDAGLTLFALDGYHVALPPSERSRYNWVLAIEAGGEPLALGGRGPLWLVRDTGGAAAPADAEATMVWALYHIKAE